MSVKEDIHVRIDEDLMHEVRAYAKQCGFSLAVAVTVLLRSGLKVNQP